MLIFLILILLCVSWAPPVSADVRLFIVPAETITTARGTQLTPKYFTADPASRWTFVPSTEWTGIRNGLESSMLVRADVDDAALGVLSKAADVIVFPANLDNNIGAGGAKVLTTWLTTNNLPTSWVAAGLSGNQVARALRGMFLLNQRIRGQIADKLVKEGLTLNTTLAELSPEQRQALRQAADDLRFTTEKMNPTDTIGDVYLDVALQQRNRPDDRPSLVLRP